MDSAGSGVGYCAACGAWVGMRHTVSEEKGGSLDMNIHAVT